MRDEKIYTNPDRFNPDRFMEEVSDFEDKRRDPRTYVFGFGRRCVYVSIHITLLIPLISFFIDDALELI